MKSVLISIRPEWVEKIASGKKTIEVRKTAPKESPFKAYIYETKGKKIECGFHFEDTGITLREKYVFGMHKARIIKHYRDEGRGKVIGEFICDKAERFSVGSLRSDDIEKLACLSYNDIINYFYKPEELDGKTAKQGFAWHISDLKIYDKPKELREFRKPLDRVWGSYCNDYCDRGCISFGSTDYSCNDYWNWEKGLTRPPQSYMRVEELGE